MHSLPSLLLHRVRPIRLPGRWGLVAALLLPGGLFGQQPSNLVDVNADGVPDLMESFQYFGGGTSGSVEVHRAIHPDNALLELPSGGTMFAMGAYIDVGLKPASFPSVSMYGRYAFRFRAADGLHYGWFEAAQPLLPGGGFWPNFTGVTVRSHGFNRVPDAPFTVGTPTSSVPAPIVLNASVVGGRLRLSWSGGASPRGYRVESRALHHDGTWTAVQTVASGSELDVDLAGDGQMYRVVRN